MAQPSAEWIWVNDQFIPWESANFHVTTHALHYGSSVFEGIRAYGLPAGPAVLGLDEHVRRLYDSCKLVRMDLPYPLEYFKQVIKDLVRRNGHKSCYIRPIVFRGAGPLGVNPRQCPVEAVILTLEWGSYLGDEGLQKGVDVMVSSWRRMAPDTYMAMAKIGGNYVNSQQIVMEAVDNGFTEGIALDVFGYVSEGSGENIFVIYRGELYTPPVGASILQGVNRGIALTLARELGITVREQNIPREMLYIADEIFFTGTAAEITPVRSVDRLPVGNGGRGPLTQALQEQFFGITSGRLPDRFGWLTPVNS
jgi:branched-chain amino acid aminotransferase